MAVKAILLGINRFLDPTISELGGARRSAAACDGDEGSLRQMRHGLSVPPRALVVAGVDGGGGQLAGLACVRSPWLPS